MLAEARFRFGEAVSLGSCALNVAIGTGDREITLSAGAWELRRRGGWTGRYGAALVLIVDLIRRWDDGLEHCRRAWIEHEHAWAKVRTEGRRAPPALADGA